MVCQVAVVGRTKPRFMFNIDGNVGPGCPNHSDDVQLVQWGYLAMVQSTLTPTALRQALIPILQRVTPATSYSGGANEPLTLAIRAHEAIRGGTQDGHVSVIKTGASGVATGGYAAGKGYILVALNNALGDTMRHQFPRLDLNPQCPPALRFAVQNILLGGVG